MYWDPLGKQPNRTRWIWLALAILATAAFEPALVAQLRSSAWRFDGWLPDFFQEWASARNLIEGLPTYTPHVVTTERYLGLPMSEVKTVLVNAHPPTSVLLALPVAWLPLDDAMLVWNLTSLGLLGLSLWIVWRQFHLRLSPVSIAATVALLFSCGPLYQQLHQGQLNLIVLFLITAAWAAERSGHARTAGALLGAAASVKVFPAFLIGYFAIRRRWSVVAAGIASMAALTLITAALLGPQAYTDYVHNVLPEVGVFRAKWNNASLPGFWNKLFNPAVRNVRFFGQPSPMALSPAAARAGTWLSSAAVLALLWRSTRRSRTREQDDLGYALAVLAMLLLSPIVWNHYFLMLLVPLAVLWKELPPTRTARLVFATAVAALWAGHPLDVMGWIVGSRLPGPVDTVTVLSYQLYALIALFGLGIAVMRQSLGRPLPTWVKAASDGVERLLADPWRTAGVIAVLAAVLARLLDLGERSLWFDEAFSWELARQPWRELIEAARQDFHPPLYFLALKAWIALFGDSAFAMRLLSVAWFGVGLAGTFLLAMEAGRGAAEEPGAPRGEDPTQAGDSGLIATLFLAASPFVFRYCQEVRMYMQEVGLATLGSWLLLRALRERQRPAPWWGAYAATAAALAYTHYFGLFTLAAHAIYVVTVWLRTRLRGKVRTEVALSHVHAACAAAIVIGLYLPWLPTLGRQRDRAVDDFWIASTQKRALSASEVWRKTVLDCVIHNEADQGRPHKLEHAVAMGLGYGLLALAGAIPLVLAVWRIDRAGRSVAVGAAVPVAAAVLASFYLGRNILVHRYLLPTFVMLLVGLGLILGRLRIRAVRWFLAGIVALYMALCVASHQRSLDPQKRSGYRGAAERIARDLEPGDTVLCLHPMDYFPMKYHARDQFAVHQARYGKLVIKRYNGGSIIHPNDYLDWATAAHRGGRIWVVGTDAACRSLDVPAGWKRISRSQFAEPIRFRGETIVELWSSKAACLDPAGLASEPPKAEHPGS